MNHISAANSRNDDQVFINDILQGMLSGVGDDFSWGAKGYTNLQLRMLNRALLRIVKDLAAQLSDLQIAHTRLLIASLPAKDKKDGAAFVTLLKSWLLPFNRQIWIATTAAVLHYVSVFRNSDDVWMSQISELEQPTDFYRKKIQEIWYDTNQHKQKPSVLSRGFFRGRKVLLSRLLQHSNVQSRG